MPSSEWPEALTCFIGLFYHPCEVSSLLSIPHVALSGKGIIVHRCHWLSPCIIIIPPLHCCHHCPQAIWPAEAMLSSSGGGLVGHWPLVIPCCIHCHHSLLSCMEGRWGRWATLLYLCHRRCQCDNKAITHWHTPLTTPLPSPSPPVCLQHADADRQQQQCPHQMTTSCRKTATMMMPPSSSHLPTTHRHRWMTMATPPPNDKEGVGDGHNNMTMPSPSPSPSIHLQHMDTDGQWQRHPH